MHVPEIAISGLFVFCWLT